jgi:choloylglycine hydrolase
VTHGVYSFQSTKSPNLFWVELAKLPFATGSPVRSIDAYDPSLDGDVSAQLQPSAKG